MTSEGLSGHCTRELWTLGPFCIRHILFGGCYHGAMQLLHRMLVCGAQSCVVVFLYSCLVGEFVVAWLCWYMAAALVLLFCKLLDHIAHLHSANCLVLWWAVRVGSGSCLRRALQLVFRFVALLANCRPLAHIHAIMSCPAHQSVLHPTKELVHG